MTASPVLRIGSRAVSVRVLQALLNDAGASPRLVVDGHFGAVTDTAVRAYQRRHGLLVDGVVGSQTWNTLRQAVTSQPDPSLPISATIPRPNKAPFLFAPTRAGAPNVFGAAMSEVCTQGRVLLPFQFKLAWDLDKTITSFVCHKLVAAHKTYVFQEAARHYGEARFRELRLDRWAGTYAPRKVRGGTSISIHAYGVATDVDSEHNGLYTPTALSPLAGPDYAPWWRIVEAVGGRALGKRIGRDWMHWSFVQE
jgi:hypothetical protein